MKVRFIVRRLAVLVVQLWGIATVVFFLVQLLPGDPRYLLAGPLATPQQLNQLTHDLGLNEPIYIRYVKYMVNIAHGNFGTSFYTSSPVLDELGRRFPATLELVTFAFLLILIVMIPLGVMSALSRKGPFARGVFVYGMAAGALPDFWWALMMVLLFYVILGIAPGPIGRIDPFLSPPAHITGLYLVDSILTGNLESFRSALGHLLLPGFTLAFVYGGQILKMTRTKFVESLGADFARYAEACGLRRRKIYLAALKNGLLPVVTLSGLTYGYLISGAVLVETVFSWGGLGQFAVQSIANFDYLSVTGTVIAFAAFALTVYVFVDILYVLIDPRIKY